MFLRYSNDTAGTSAGSVAMFVDQYADATVPERVTLGVRHFVAGKPVGVHAVLNAPKNGRESRCKGKRQGASPEGRTRFAARRCSRNRLNGASRSRSASIMAIFSPNGRRDMSG